MCYNYEHFQEIIDECGSWPKKIPVAKWSEVYNRSMKSWLQDN